MGYFEVVLLHCLNKIGNERTPISIYHLLKGKKSVQTIQDSKLFGLSQWFNTYPQLTKKQLNETITHLHREKLIINDHSHYSLTDKAIELLHIHSNQIPPKYLNGWKYHTVDQIFWKRLNLVVQVIPYWEKGDQQFFPVQRDPDIQYWVKSFLLSNKTNKKWLVEQIHRELETFFEMVEDYSDPLYFLLRFSGYKKTGLTEEQIAQFYNVDLFYYITHFRAILHHLMKIAWEKRGYFPVLYRINQDLFRTIPLTKTAETTYKLFNQGYSIEKIAKIRHLKVQTIEDHIVEIAFMDPSFSIDQFVNKNTQQKVLQIVHQMKTKKLKEIKKQLDPIDYFSIRLVLAKLGE